MTNNDPETPSEQGQEGASETPYIEEGFGFGLPPVPRQITARALSPAEIIGKHSNLDIPEPKELSKNAKKFVCLTYKQQFLLDQEVTPNLIWKQWPTSSYAGLSLDNLIEDEEGKVFQPGTRPTINAIQHYFTTDDFAQRMWILGVEVSHEASGLTVEQMGLLTILTNVTDGRGLRQKIKAANVPWSRYQAWLKQPAFNQAYRKLVSDALKDSIPAAETALSQKMVAGDLASIKFGFELTGHYNPADKKQVDAVKMVSVILEVIEENVRDPEILKKIGAQIQLRGLGAVESQ